MCIYGKLASEKNYALALSNPKLNVDKYSQKTYYGRFKLYIMLPLLCVCTNVPKVGTVKHVYSDHAYYEMTLITKRLGIPGKHSIYFLINFTLTAKLDITKSRL